MRAMILAAGRGERMGDLTQNIPKPLLRINEHYLIEYAIASMKRAGITEIVINVSYHAEQIQAALGDGDRYGVNLFYSVEPERLETGGGILQALPLLGDDYFVVVSSDIISDYPLKRLLSITHSCLAHLVMVANPLYHARGDYGLVNNKISKTALPTLTYANLGVFHPQLFAEASPGYFRLTEVLNPAIDRGFVTGEYYAGQWYNIGTPADLYEINQRAREDSNLRPLASETNTLSN